MQDPDYAKLYKWICREEKPEKLTHEIDLTDDLRDYFNKIGDFIIIRNNVYRIYRIKDNASIL